MFNSLSDLFKNAGLGDPVSSIMGDRTSNLLGANPNGFGAPTSSSPAAVQQVAAPQPGSLPSSDQMYQQVNDWIGGRSFDDIVKPYQDNSAAALNYAKQNHLEDFDTSQFGPGFGDRVDVKPGFSFIPVDGHDGKYLSFEHGLGWQGSDHDYVKVTRGPNGEAIPAMTHHSSAMTPLEKLVAGGTIALAGAGFGQAAAGLMGGVETGAVSSALPSGGMAATGTAAPWAAGDAALGSGFYGTSDAAIGNLMGTTQGAFGWGTGLSGVSASDLAAAGSGTDWLSNAQRLGKLLKSNGQPAGAPASGGSTGGGFGGLSTSSTMSQPQGMELVPKFSAAPPGQSDYFGELGNSQKINQLAQALMSYKGSING